MSDDSGILNVGISTSMQCFDDFGSIRRPFVAICITNALLTDFGGAGGHASTVMRSSS